MGKDLTFNDLEHIIRDLKFELADHKEIEAKAHAIFNEFKEVAERIGSGIYRYDIKSRKFFFFNRAASALLGAKEISTRAITTETVSQRIHPEDLAKVREAARKSKAPQNTGGDVEYRYANRDGTYAWLYDRWAVLRDARGEPRYIEGIVMDITQRKLAEQALAQSERELRMLSNYLLQAQEKERRRVALELHDDLGQKLTVLKLYLRSIKRKSASHEQILVDECEKASDYVDQIIEDVRRLSHDLCPSVLEDLGLDASIRQIIEDFGHHTQINVTLEAELIDTRFSLESKTLIYRIFQEAFTNIQRHSQADNVHVLIKSDGRKVYFQIVDDGKGFVNQFQDGDTSTRGNDRGLGLTTMSERTRMLKGAFKVYSIIGIGTRVAFQVPTDY